MLDPGAALLFVEGGTVSEERRTYTPDQARRIVAGLANGGRQRPRALMMSESEWQRSYDPPTWFEAELLELLKDISLSLRRLEDRPPSSESLRFNTRYAPAAPRSGGPVEL